MIELNKVMLVGRLTFDPDYRETSTGRPVAKIRLAVSRRRFGKDSGAAKDEVAFVDCDVWNKQAEFVRDYLRKGSAVFVEGRLKQDQWQDKETGKNMSKVCVVVERIIFAETKAKAEQRQSEDPQQEQGNAEPRYDYEEQNTDDDLPF